MQMISTSTISTFAFSRAILKIINRKLTELKLLLVFKPISLVSIETVSHDILTRLGKRGKTHGLLCCAQLLSSLFKTKTKRNMSLMAESVCDYQSYIFYFRQFLQWNAFRAIFCIELNIQVSRITVIIDWFNCLVINENFSIFSLHNLQYIVIVNDLAYNLLGLIKSIV